MSISENLRKFNRKMHNDIAIAHQMGIQVVNYDRLSVAVKAPIISNRNDKFTAFAGSLSSVCALTGWSLISLLLREGGYHANVAIYDSHIRFLKPVVGDIISNSQPLTEDTVEGFITQFVLNAKAKLTVNATIVHAGELAVKFEGKYVAMRAENFL